MSSLTDKPAPLQLTEFDLAPSWAQGPRTSISSPTSSGDGRRSDRKPRSGARPSASSFQRERPDNRRNAHPQGNIRDANERSRDRRGDAPSRNAMGPEFTPLPIAVHFIPARHGMENLARRLADSRRAYALGDLTVLFLNRPEALVVRLMPDSQALAPGQSASNLFQCRLCRRVYLAQDTIAQHVLTAHLENFYQSREETVEPPSGNFNCVARCGLSGELIGPPNYHGYHERLTTLHRDRFSHMPFEAYRARLEMCRDPETIETWQASMRQRIVYQPVTAGKTEDAAEASSAANLQSLSDVQRHFMQHGYLEAVQENVTCTIPGPVAGSLDDAHLKHCIDSAWRRESRSIMRTAITVRGMLRSLGFTAFKTGDQRAFMSAVAPNPLEPAETVEIIRRMLDYVEAHPGCSRTDLWEHLGCRPDENIPGAETRHFQWLVDKGHLIYFQDGTVTVPSHLHAIRTPTVIRHRKRKNH